jgi:hypothetical protein
VCCFFSGLPNTFGGYDETPEMTGKNIKVSIHKHIANGESGFIQNGHDFCYCALHWLSLKKAGKGTFNIGTKKLSLLTFGTNRAK